MRVRTLWGVTAGLLALCSGSSRPFMPRKLRGSTRRGATSSLRGGSSANATTAVQRVYDVLKSIPSGQLADSVQNPGACSRMRECMEMCNGVTLAELNISEADIEAMEKQRLCRCMHVCDDENFEMNIFIIPKGKSLPFHDHPGMTVVSKVVRGTLRLRSLSQISVSDNPPLLKRARTPAAAAAAAAAAVSPTAEVKTPLDPAWFLAPTIGNVHELFAESTCIVFDVLMPPYKPPERDCTYYKLSVDGSSLERAEEPEDNDAVWGAKYAGVRVVTSQDQKK